MMAQMLRGRSNTTMYRQHRQPCPERYTDLSGASNLVGTCDRAEERVLTMLTLPSILLLS